jgi:hypothetical protein
MKKNDFDGLHVGTGGDHVHGDGNAGVERVAEGDKHILASHAGNPLINGDFALRAVGFRVEVGGAYHAVR